MPPNQLPPSIAKFAPLATYYYQAPIALLGFGMLHELLREDATAHPFFEANPHVLTIIAAQLGDIAAGKGRIVRRYEAEFANAPFFGRKLILRALANCGDKETSQLLDDWLADPRFTDHRAELEALQQHLADDQRKHVRDLPAQTPADLDLLWANFFITGEYAPIARILDVFDLPDTRETEVLKRVAKWSLGSNLQKHPWLVELVTKNKYDRPAGSLGIIAELILTDP